jgi:hypothetical protein
LQVDYTVAVDLPFGALFVIGATNQRAVHSTQRALRDAGLWSLTPSA